MTGNVLIDLAISIIGIALLVALARVIFPKAGAVAISEGSVRDRLAFDEPDFQIAALLLDTPRGAALALGKMDDIALVKKTGDGLVTRRAHRSQLRCHRDGAELRIGISDHSFRGFAVSANSDAEAQRWAVRIAGEGAI